MGYDRSSPELKVLGHASKNIDPKSKNGHVSAKVWPIGTNFGKKMHI